MSTIAVLATTNANDNSVADLIIAAKSMIQHAKGNFDRQGDVHASRMMIGPLNCLGLAIERLLAERAHEAAQKRITETEEA